MNDESFDRPNNLRKGAVGLIDSPKVRSLRKSIRYGDYQSARLLASGDYYASFAVEEAIDWRTELDEIRTVSALHLRLFCAVRLFSGGQYDFSTSACDLPG